MKHLLTHSFLCLVHGYPGPGSQRATNHGRGCRQNQEAVLRWRTYCAWRPWQGQGYWGKVSLWNVSPFLYIFWYSYIVIICPVTNTLDDQSESVSGVRTFDPWAKDVWSFRPQYAKKKIKISTERCLWQLKTSPIITIS